MFTNQPPSSLVSRVHGHAIMYPITLSPLARIDQKSHYTIPHNSQFAIKQGLNSPSKQSSFAVKKNSRKTVNVRYPCLIDNHHLHLHTHSLLSSTRLDITHNIPSTQSTNAASQPSSQPASKTPHDHFHYTSGSLLRPDFHKFTKTHFGIEDMEPAIHQRQTRYEQDTYLPSLSPARVTVLVY